MNKTIYVYENWDNSNPLIVGRLYIDKEKNFETYSFEYDDEWLKSKYAFSLSSELPLFRGRQFPLDGKNLFSTFEDSCPDRWGRLLIQRKEAINARKEGRKPKKLEESDYLLNVYDESRMGAIRFSLDNGQSFESSDDSLITPPMVDLRKLESASLAFENDESGLDERWINQLIAPGSSLGGARPKASVKDIDGSFWIAKFPSKHDNYNCGAWEKVVHDLAALCGLDVPEARIDKFSPNGSTFIVKRFDREREKRIHFASAMSLLNKRDGDVNVSYLDIVSFIKSQGSNPKNDLVELWKRIVFNMAVSNTDDHLRNHGFLLNKKGWTLSPMFDVNPVPFGNSLSLMVNDTDSTIDFNLALSTASEYGIEDKEANEISSQIIDIVKNNWERVAKQNGLSRESIEYMRPAFVN